MMSDSKGSKTVPPAPPEITIIVLTDETGSRAQRRVFSRQAERVPPPTTWGGRVSSSKLRMTSQVEVEMAPT